MQEGDSGELVTEESEIIRLIRLLQSSKSLITIRFGKEREIFSSLVVTANNNADYFVIDETTPDKGNLRLRNGEPFSLIAFHDGIQILCKDLTTLPSRPKGILNAFAVAFPAHLIYKQRRQAYRVSTPSLLKARAVLESPARKKPIEAEIIDISVGGIGLKIPKKVSPSIEPSEVFTYCQIEFPGRFSLTATVVAIQPHYDKYSDVLLCGFRFSKLEPKGQKQLDKFIISLQRELKKLLPLSHSEPIDMRNPENENL